MEKQLVLQPAIPTFQSLKQSTTNIGELTNHCTPPKKNLLLLRLAIKKKHGEDVEVN